jgi:anti-anti-sigma factor
LEVTVSAGDAQVVVEAAGDIDMLTVQRLREALQSAVRIAGTGSVVVDLGRVPFMDSSGVQALVDGYHTAMLAGGTLTVRGAHGSPARVLHLVGLARMLGVESPRHDAGGPAPREAGGPAPRESERPG